MSVTLTDHQWEAVNTAARWYREADASRHRFGMFGTGNDGESMLGKGQDFFLGGFAGTGKSTILPALIEKCRVPIDRVAFVAPTGKAAKVMSTKMKDFGIYQTATTIHKLIYLPGAERADKIQRQIENLAAHQAWLVTNGNAGRRSFEPEVMDLGLPEIRTKLMQLQFSLARAMEDNEGPKFALRNPDEFPEQVDLIVCDEGSMVGSTVADDLAAMGRPILVMGDPGQLPPVGDDYGFNCHEPDAFLTEIHRQARDNPIIRLATDAREGRELDLGDYGNGVKVVDRKHDDATLDMDREAMVLCGTHKKRWVLTKKIRDALGFTETGPGAGEPLICRRNSRKLAHMVNGALYTNKFDHGELVKGNDRFELTVTDPDTDFNYTVSVTQGPFEEHQARKRNSYTTHSSLAFKANRECEHFDFGHVLTCHSAQGSQWDDVVVHDESPAFKAEANRWLYTAITRAAKRLTVVQ